MPFQNTPGFAPMNMSGMYNFSPVDPLVNSTTSMPLDNSALLLAFLSSLPLESVDHTIFQENSSHHPAFTAQVPDMNGDVGILGSEFNFF
jgi:hypothetical protein